MGLQRTRQQGHTIESIHDTMINIRQMYPKAGIREVISLLFHEKSMSISRSFFLVLSQLSRSNLQFRTVVSSYFAIFEPELVCERKARCLKRRHFWAASVNDLFAVNQHNKWLRFGLGLHTGIEPFSGRIMWIHVWHSNRNPQLILSYYLDTIKELGHESSSSYYSNTPANIVLLQTCHLLLRVIQVPKTSILRILKLFSTNTMILTSKECSSTAGCIPKNVMPEITWSQL